MTSMASTSTGVLPFVRGIDLSRNDFSSGRFPNEIAEMKQATWLYLNRFLKNIIIRSIYAMHSRTLLDQVPDVLSELKNLERLQMAWNGIQNVHGELSDLPLLRSIIFRHNQV